MIGEKGFYERSFVLLCYALYIENVLYTVSDKKIKMNSLEDLTEIKEIQLS
ncbi:MAG: beta-propeller domain-containing protein [Candidatus Bathyarchaeota archaeon]|nr:beta-propeller domain-containing protein [Candidatus Bathyarchaeota archaeon]